MVTIFGSFETNDVSYEPEKPIVRTLFLRRNTMSYIRVSENKDKDTNEDENTIHLSDALPLKNLFNPHMPPHHTNWNISQEISPAPPKICFEGIGEVTLNVKGTCLIHGDVKMIRLSAEADDREFDVCPTCMRVHLQKLMGVGFKEVAK